MNVDKHHSPNVLEDQTRLQNSTDTTKKNLIFRVLCALFEKFPSGINRDILKNPTRSGAKNSNKPCVPSHLVTWIPHCAHSYHRFVEIHLNARLDVNNAGTKSRHRFIVCA